MKIKFIRALMILTVVVILAGIHLYINTQNIALKYEVTDLKAKLAKIKSSNRELGGNVAIQENLPKIEKIAKNKLGMIYPKKMNYVLVTAGASAISSKEANP
jgi:cell division protein FtsL